MRKGLAMKASNSLMAIDDRKKEPRHTETDAVKVRLAMTSLSNDNNLLLSSAAEPKF